jgi:hypothetical protein
MTYIATPDATTMAIAKACAFIASRSRSSFRLSAETRITRASSP